MADSVTMVQGESKILTYNVVDENGTAVNVTGATGLWELSRSPGDTAILTKTTADDITAAGTTVTVSLSSTDTADLEGVYWMELSITDTVGNTSKPQNMLLVNTQIQPEVTP